MSVESGNPSTPATPAAAAAAPPSAGAVQTPTTPASPTGVVAAAQPQTVTIPLEQLHAFTSVQARLAQLETELGARDAAARAEQVKLHAQKGEIEDALRIQREEAQSQINMEKNSRNAMEERAKRYALDGELSRVLSSHPLVSGGAEQLTQLWRSQFVVEPAGESFQVRTPTFQSVADHVAAQLAKPEYSHFVRAHNPNGGTAGGPASGGSAAPTSPANPAAPQVPKNFGEAIILQMQSLAKEQPSDPRMNPAAAMGLNSRSMVRSS